jgi:hypothetical protein
MAANPPLFLALANLKQAADIPGLPGFPALAVYQVPRKYISTPKKKVREFPVPSRDVTTKLSLGGNNDVITELFLPRGSLVSDIPAGDGKLVNLFLRCSLLLGNIKENFKK